MTRTCLIAALATPGLAGCVAQPKLAASGAGTSSAAQIERDSHDVTFTCKSERRAPERPLRRLSKLQYTNTVRDLVRAELPSHADAILRALAPVLKQLPADATSKGAPFATMDQATTQSHVDTYYRVSSLLANEMTASDARIAQLLGCPAGGNDNECVQRYIERLGRRAFRHPLSDLELTYLRGVYGTNGIHADALRDVIMVALNAPQFLYRVEQGDQAVPGNPRAVALTPYEVVSRLAYHFWQTAPDDALLDAAARGEVATDEGYRRVLDRVIADARSEAGLAVFVSEWLDLASLEPLDRNAGDLTFKEFAGKDLPWSTLREAMTNEVVESFVYHVKKDDSFAAFFESPYSFTRDARLAALYGVAKWDPAGEPPRFPEGERAGLLTRAALLATGTINTRPIKKGVFIRERILCDRLGAPPANSANIPAELERALTSREVVERLTEQPGSNCSTCHASMINPLGFATEGFDALGRKRDRQALFENAKQVDSRPVDSKSVPRVWLDDGTPSAGPHDLSSQIVRSGRGEACFARQYLRFTYGRREHEDFDGCALEAVRTALQEGHSLQQALRAPALRPEFRQRYLGDVQT